METNNEENNSFSKETIIIKIKNLFKDYELEDYDNAVIFYKHILEILEDDSKFNEIENFYKAKNTSLKNELLIYSFILKNLTNLIKNVYELKRHNDMKYILNYFKKYLDERE